MAVLFCNFVKSDAIVRYCIVRYYTVAYTGQQGVQKFSKIVINGYFVQVYNSKKSLVHKKNLSTERKFEKCCEAKRGQRPYKWAQKKFQPEKIKIVGVAFI